MGKNVFDKGLKSFIYISFLLISFFILFIVFSAYFYFNSMTLLSEYIFLFLIVFGIAILLFFLSSTISIAYAYNKNRVSKLFLTTFKKGINIFLPLIVSLSVFFNYNKEYIRLFYIRINNIYVESWSKKYAPEKVLLLLPHCLQYSECKHRITNDIKNCRRCGRCPIHHIVEISEKTGVNIVLATGGTAALNIVNRLKPEIILAVACVRDLASGIADVRGIPVIGVLNERPNGPCINTTVDIEMLKKTIDNIII